VQEVLKNHQTLPIELNTANSQQRRNTHVNFYLPHNFGGFADPLPDLAHVNIYTDDVDLPQMKPKTAQQTHSLQQVHEFYT
jgi:hypothetical protein